MSNSSLVNYTKISPNSSARTAKIDTITIHHMACNLSVEVCGAGFAQTSRAASSNYGIGTDGRIGLYVDESRRAWTSSNWQNDNRAITIEVANDGGAPDWHVSDKALAATIDLCVDICQRNGISRLNYTGDTSGNLTMHKWFAATACPGPYLGGKFPYIAEEVNKRLGASGFVDSDQKENVVNSVLCVGDEVTLTSDAKYTTGKNVPAWVIKKTLYVRNVSGDNVTISIYKAGAITGVVSKKYIVKNGQSVSSPVVNTPVVSTPTVSTSTLNVGDEVKLISGAKYTTGKSVPTWVINKTLYVRQVYSNGDVVISTLKTGAITGVVNPKYLLKQGQPVTTKPSTSTTPAAPTAPVNFSVGDVVKLTPDATYYNGKSIAAFVFKMKLYVRELQGDNVVISIFKSGAITGTVNKKYLTKY